MMDIDKLLSNMDYRTVYNIARNVCLCFKCSECPISKACEEASTVRDANYAIARWIMREAE